MKLGRFNLFLYATVCFSVFSAVRPPLLISPDELTAKKEKREKSESEPKKEKKKNPNTPTSWGGFSLIQEEKTIQGLKTLVYSLSGGAWILHNKVKLTAQEIQVVGEDAIEGYLKGGVRVEDLESKAFLKSGIGEYDKFKELVTLRKRPVMIYKDKNSRNTKITSPLIIRELGEKKTSLDKNPVIENSDFILYTDKAVYSEPEENIFLDNHPLVFGENKYITADKITYNSESRELTLDSNSLISQISFEKKRKAKSTQDKDKQTLSEEPSQEEEVEEKIKVVTVFTGDKIIYNSKEQPKNTGLYGNARMIRPDSEFKSDFIKTYGENHERMEARGKVEFLDKENQIRILGDLLEHEKADGYTHVTENAKIEFLNEKSGEVSSTLTATEIERFSEKKESIARGNVIITSEDSIIKGEYSTYFEAEEKLVMEGNPTLQKDGKTALCGKIIMYPKINKILIEGGLKSLGGEEKPK